MRAAREEPSFVFPVVGGVSVVVVAPILFIDMPVGPRMFARLCSGSFTVANQEL